MQHLDPARQRPLYPLNPPRADKEAALQPQHRLAPLAVYLGADDEQSVRLSGRRVARRVAAPHRDLGRRLVHHLEVVRYLRADLVRRLLKLGDGPQLVCGLGTLVFARKVGALEAVAWLVMVSLVSLYMS